LTGQRHDMLFAPLHALGRNTLSRVCLIVTAGIETRTLLDMSFLFEKLEVYQRAVNLAERVIKDKWKIRDHFLRGVTERRRLLSRFKRRKFPSTNACFFP